MSTKTVKLAVVLPLFALLAAVAAAPAAADDDFAISLLLGKPGQLSRTLALTAPQVDRFRTLSKAANAVAKPLLAANVELLAQMRGQYSAASPDLGAIGQAALSRHQNWLEARAAYLEFDQAFSAILTPAQLTIWVSLKAGNEERAAAFARDPVCEE
jgi:Spy/CpxP family protein refolding chaperone